MSVTIRDVAERAHVSFQLVSAVLGGKRYARASAATRERIAQAVRELGYSANVSARILRGGASGVIGVLIDSEAPDATFLLLSELEHAAAVRGYRILITESHDSPAELVKAYHSFKQNAVDGIISLANDYPGIQPRMDEVLREEKKLLFVCGIRNRDCSWVDVDIADAIVKAVAHLRKEGCRNIAFLCHEQAPPSISIQQRISGFRSVLPEGPVLCLPQMLRISLESILPHARALVRNKIVKQGIDGVIAQNDYYAALLEKELLRAGFHVPGDVAVVGCDNLPLCHCMPVSLSSISFDRDKMAEKCMEIILELIHGNPGPLHATFQPHLIIRESSRRKSLKKRSAGEKTAGNGDVK